jgi:hypothetical protein
MSKEQHPVDKLFVRKLGDREATPSAEAWNRLQAGLGQKKRSKKGLIWLPYATAAAVVLLLGALWLLTTRQYNDTKPAIAVQPATQSGQDSQVATRLPNQPSTGEARPDQPATGSLTAQSPAVEAATTEEKINPAPLAKTGSVRKANKKSGGLPVQEGISPEAPIVANAPEAQLSRPSEEKVTPVATLPQSEDQVLVVVVQIPEAATSDATENTPDQEMESPEVAPRTRTGKLLESLKKVKQAEFRELGLTADNVMARFREKNEKQ